MKLRILLIFIVLVISIAGFLYATRPGSDQTPLQTNSANKTGNEKKTSDCDDPLSLKSPVDLNLTTSILYPGQVRGGDFKPHGGFRFDNSKNEAIEVKMPRAAKFVEASRYIEMGEVQYMFDFETSCGIRYRFDHLLVLTPKFAKIAEGLPKAKVDDSRTTSIRPSVDVEEDEVIATAVGFKNTKNVFVDFGVYDKRGKFFSNPRDNAVCWFDLLPPKDATLVKSLPPADSISGSQSTLCKP